MNPSQFDHLHCNLFNDDPLESWDIIEELLTYTKPKQETRGIIFFSDKGQLPRNDRSGQNRFSYENRWRY